MRIVQLSAEFSPIAKAGGLGEVVLGLSRELTALGHTVEVILPKYDFIQAPAKLEVPNFQCLKFNNAMWNAEVEGCSLHLLEARHPAGYFHRQKIYGCPDDVPRFLYFTRACLEYLLLQNQPIDILHLHDWHVSVAAYLVKTVFKSLKIGKVVLSLHNVEYQGKCAAQDLETIGLSSWTGFQDDNPLYPETINLLKGGLVHADLLVPVSPTYGKEILTAKQGFGLQTTLKALKPKIKSVLNGIDIRMWDPAKDPHLKKPYTIESVQQAKGKNKSALPLDSAKRPWVGAVTRIVSQKGPELLEAAIETVLALDGCFLLLGSSPEPRLQAHFDRLKQKYEGSSQVLLLYEYNDALARQIYAALDFLLIPSHFEPCGLTQMIGMRYGTVPIARATGGLKDTIFDCEDARTPASKRNGFLFTDATRASMDATLRRAFALFRQDPATYQSLVRRGMQTDFSWKKPAEQYLKLFRSESLADIDPISIEIVADRNRRIDGSNHNREKTDLLQQGQ